MSTTKIRWKFWRPCKDISARPPTAHTIDIHNNDYIINWTYFCVETIIKINSNQQPPKVSPQHPNLRHFGRPHIAHTIDIYSNDYMINWTYFCSETSSKSIVTNHLRKVSPQHVNLRHFGRPPIAHTIDIYNNDYMINWTYFCNETSSKSTVTNSLQKCHHSTQICDISGDPLYSKLNYSNHSHTHNSNHLEPLGKNRKPPARFARFGG